MSGARIGPGTLVLVVGPSGAGKDTLIGLARARLSGEKRVLFARRLVTRAPGAGEAHGTLSEAAFEAECAAGRFPLSWRAHGLGYALGPEVATHLGDGGLVVANGSRASLPQARARFARMKVVLVTAPLELRAARLAQRGRESAPEIAERLSHAPQAEVAPDLVIENVGSPQVGGEALRAFIAAELAHAPARAQD
ncbi:phosphonate metabolism protein/1,5-bisphosphokinase (PRPP-forming) PhnN [Xanthobacter sp. KR7-225]|uniref:phosphonate metabolism protein/1,5-bisphosphokinase (PRPP-forming) PhnN n=1 Tax=Xanthobacter sp. KR7-225 TaxID=3156613 RepID=UPI0032B46705